jgi:hypothetical protein
MQPVSELRSHPEALPATNEPLRIAVRRLRWFRAAFHRHAEAYAQDLGCAFEVDDAKLAGVFVRWLEAIDMQKPAEKTERRAFFEFAAALMLRELIADMPIRAKQPPTKAGPDTAGGFWPEGYACSMFCISIHGAAMEQEFHVKTEVAPVIEDLSAWWSFRENAGRDAGFSAGFLQLLLGQQPNWMMPDVFRARLQSELLSGPAA